MTRRRAGKIRAELAKIWQDNPLLSSRDLVAKFKKTHGNTPDFDLDDVVDYGLMELAGQVSKTPLIPDGQGSFLAALGDDPDRKVLRRTIVIRVQQDQKIVPLKLDLEHLQPEKFAALDIVDVQPKRRSSPTPLEVLRRDMKKMAAEGKSNMEYGDFLRSGG
jgi:hypothetical protein